MRKTRNRARGRQPYQDGIFRMLFSDKERLLELYNAVSGKNYGPETALKITTLESEVFDRRKNDISFLLDDKLIVFLEQQSTVNFNMPLRFLLYCAKTYGIMVPKSEIYEKKAIRLPRPEFFVFYTGRQRFPERKEMFLSDSFADGAGDTLDLKVTCFNINYPLGAAMLERSKTLQEYSWLIHRIRELRDEGLELEAAIDRAMDECRRGDVLTAFLKDHEGEMRGMLFRALSDEEFREVYTRRGYKEGLEDGMEQGLAAGMERGLEAGRQEGLAEAARLAAARMRGMGLGLELICEATGLSAEEVQTL